MSESTLPFRCSACAMAGQPSPVLAAVCSECLSRAALRARKALIEAGLPHDAERLMDERLLTDVGMSFVAVPQPDVARPGDVEAVALHRGRLLWLLADQLADAHRELEDARGELRRHGLLFDGYDLADGIFEAVQRAVGHEQVWRETVRELEDGERAAERAWLQTLEHYHRERRSRADVAAVACRLIVGAHTAGHAGAVETCPTCAADWAVVQAAG